MYEKAVCPPAAGSLRDALFQTVWLKRQEADVLKTYAVVQGLAEVVSASGHSAESTSKAFKKFLEAALPFAKTARTAQEKEMLQVMDRESKKGAILFSQVNSNPLKNAAMKRVSMTDETRKKIQEGIRKRK